MLIEKGIAYTIKKGRNLMHRSVLISLGLVLCFLISGCTAQRGQLALPSSSQPAPSSRAENSMPESSVPASEPEQGKSQLPIRDTTGWSEGRMTQIVETVSRYFTEQRDPVREGDLTEADVTRLWYLVNTIYDADDVAFVDDMAEPPDGVPAGLLVRFLDFDEATRYLFTSHGLEQLFSAQMAGIPYIYQAKNGEVYHRGPYKTGYSYQNAMTGWRIVGSSQDSAQVEVSWEVQGPLDWNGERPEAYSTLYLKREDDRWKIDGYNFPAASYPEEFTISEETRVTLTGGGREITLSDDAEKERIVAGLRELTMEEVTHEAPTQDCIAIAAVEGSRVFSMLAAPDGRVWDTLFAQDDWILYQADPSFYQELQNLLK